VAASLHKRHVSLPALAEAACCLPSPFVSRRWPCGPYRLA
jgi:hypothetical protein